MKVKEKRKVNNRPRKIKFGLLKKTFFRCFHPHPLLWVDRRGIEKEQASEFHKFFIPWTWNDYKFNAGWRKYKGKFMEQVKP